MRERSTPACKYADRLDLTRNRPHLQDVPPVGPLLERLALLLARVHQACARQPCLSRNTSQHLTGSGLWAGVPCHRLRSGASGLRRPAVGEPPTSEVGVWGPAAGVPCLHLRQLGGVLQHSAHILQKAHLADRGRRCPCGLKQSLSLALLSKALLSPKSQLAPVHPLQGAAP